MIWARRGLRFATVNFPYDPDQRRSRQPVEVRHNSPHDLLGMHVLATAAGGRAVFHPQGGCSRIAPVHEKRKRASNLNGASGTFLREWQEAKASMLTTDYHPGQRHKEFKTHYSFLPTLPRN